MTPTKEQLADPKWWRDNDPSGGEATHWTGSIYASNKWLRKAGSKRFWRSSDDWMKYTDDSIADAQFSEAHQRPTQPQWNGEGLPPVRWTHKECAIAGLGSDDEFEIVAHRGGYAIVVFGPTIEDENISTAAVSPEEFGPIRTQAEIAREETVELAMENLKAHQWTPREFSESLYDAGMLRKPMSREDAFARVLTRLPSEVSTGVAADILDALGFKE